MKAESFANQYIRTTVKDKIDFWLFPVEAEDYHLFTAEKWESELFRQIQLLINQLILEGRIDEEYSQPGSQPNLSDEMEAVLQQKEDVPYDSKDPLYPFGFGLDYNFEVSGN